MRFCSCSDQLDRWSVKAVIVLLFSTVMYLKKENLVSSILLTSHEYFVFIWGILRFLWFLFCLWFSLFLLETQGGPEWRSFVVRNVLWFGFSKPSCIQWMRGIWLEMISEPCTFMLRDCETLTFVTQKGKLFSKGGFILCVWNLGAMSPGKS